MNALDLVSAYQASNVPGGKRLGAASSGQSDRLRLNVPYQSID